MYLPVSASAGKAAKLAALGARLVRVGGDAVEAEVAARAEAARLGATYVSPYNDPVASPLPADCFAVPACTGFDTSSSVAIP